METAVPIVPTLISGLFAMSEISPATVRQARLRRFIDAGDRAAQVAAHLGAKPTSFLSTIPTGISSVGMLSSIILLSIGAA